MRKFVYSALTGGAFLVVATTIAMAQTVTPATEQSWFVSIFDTLRPSILDLVGLVVVALVGWLVKIVKDRFGIEIEAKHREALQSALNNAVNLVFGALVPSVGKTQKVLTDGVADVKAAVDYVKKSVPDAVKHFDLSDARIKELLEPKIVAKTESK